MYCVKCKENLETYGEMAHVLYQQICESYFYGGKCWEFQKTEPSCFGIVLDESYVALTKFLESKGYIVTTEASYDRIKAKPTKIKYSSNDIDMVVKVCSDRCNCD